MYIVKNALKSISRSIGRNVLIGIIVLVIAIAACLGLSIRQAAQTAKEDTLEGLTITGQISFDRASFMGGFGKGQGGEGQEQGDRKSFDKDSFRQNFSEISSLTLDEMLTYSELDSVKSFYYTITASMNGTDELEAVTTTDSADKSEDSSSDIESFGNASEEQNQGGSDMPFDMPGGDMGGKGGFRKGTMGVQGDFTVIGYSSDEAMTDFINGTSTIEEGEVFEENTSELECIISNELATYNEVEVGDTISIANPNDEEEIYELTVVGIYNNSQATVSDSFMMGGFSTSTDPANQICMSYTALKSIIDESEANATTETDEETGIETTTALPEQLSGTYVFASVDDYERFSEDVYDAGLDSSYTVSSSDITSYENSMLPLENLSKMALYFLIVVLGIGAVVLVVFNIFIVRERKYEVGVLTAIGMKKAKVSLQFILENLMVTLVAVVLGCVIGATTSVPVTNSLLKSQIESQQTTQDEQFEAFGRESGMKGGMPDGEGMPGVKPGGGRGGMMDIPSVENMMNSPADYISEVKSATNVTVLLQLLGIGLGLTVVASAASVIFIMRYDPLKILANRD